MAGPKVVVVGAGSYFFGRPVIHKMATSPVMAGGTLALVDTDSTVLRTMTRLARRICDHTGCGVKVVGSTKRREVLRDADFVVLTFSRDNAHFRGVDTEIASRHGMTMCSSDTIGPGGIFRTLREAPLVLDMARDVARVAPDAWVINLVNPTSAMGIALMRHAPEVRSFALCDGNHEPANTLNYCKAVGILPEDAKVIPPAVQAKLDLRIAGVNHCTFLFHFTYDGKNMLPAYRRRLAAEVREEKKDPHEHSKQRYNKAYALQLMDLYGGYPTAVGHTKEYVPFYQGYGAAPVKPEPIIPFDAPQRAKQMAAAMQMTRQYAAGKLSATKFLRETIDDHATNIIESMWGGLGRSYFINASNRGAVTNLADDAFLELRSDVDMHGPRPHPVGELPRGMLALTQQVLDTHELTVEAAVTGNRKALRLAMLTDPICNNITDADACIRELLKVQRKVLPAYWR